MKYSLDTDTLIYFLKNNPHITQHIAQTPPTNIHTTIINHSELLFGAYHSTHKKRNLETITGLLSNIKILPFCEQASTIFAEQKALLKTKGNIIADIDLMIASICLTHNMTLVTNNIRHFDRIKSLKLKNWAQNP